jgi:23S rRNA maturation-related 3'-5' exoribonuclease YhaM
MSTKKVIEDILHNLLFKSNKEFVKFEESTFSHYDSYNKSNPNRFEVRYDQNMRRKWVKTVDINLTKSKIWVNK